MDKNPHKKAKYSISNEGAKKCSLGIGGPRCNCEITEIDSTMKEESNENVNSNDHNEKLQAPLSHKKFKKSKSILHSCYFCRDVFPTKENLDLHIKFHGFDVRLACRVCNETFSCYTDLNQHLITHQASEYICKLCNSKHTNFFSYRRHLFLHNEYSNGQFECECGVLCDEWEKMRLHKDIHEKYKGTWCYRCKKYFIFKDFCLQHLDLHHTKCFYRKKEFKSRYYLKQHLETVHNEKSELTTKKDFSEMIPQSSNLKESTALSHGSGDNENISKYMTATDMPTHMLRCWMCLVKFANKDAKKFREHLKTHEAYKTNEFICIYCGWNFFYLIVYVRHMASHFKTSESNTCQVGTKTIFCVNCKQTFREKSQYEDHKNSHVICLYCSRNFPARKDLIKHVKFSHNGFPVDVSNCERFCCTICNETHASFLSLKKHLEVMHKNEMTAKEKTSSHTVVGSQVLTETTTLKQEDIIANSAAGISTFNINSYFIIREIEEPEELNIKCESEYNNDEELESIIEVHDTIKTEIDCLNFMIIKQE